MMIFKASSADARDFSESLRKEDVEELRVASRGMETEDSLLWSIANADVAYAAYTNDYRPVMLGGITARDTLGIIWGVATPLITKNVKTIATLTRPVIRDWFLMFPEVRLMFNHSLTANTVHHRWLKWAGAELFAPVPKGPNGELFTPFVIRRSDYV